MSAPLSIRLSEDLDAIIRERASAPGLTITEVIVTALRRGLDQPDPVHEDIRELKQQMQGPLVIAQIPMYPKRQTV